MTGDFNARTGSLPDYVNHDSDLHIPLPPDYMVDTPIPRKSEDCVVNNYGRELLDLCIASRLRILNGRTRLDNNKGAFTCFTPRGASVVDYTIVSDDFLNYVSCFQVGDISSFSDHCPLYLHLSTEPGSFFRISRMNMLPKNLLQDVLERMDTHQEGVGSLMELETESPVQVLHTPEDKLAEIFSNRDFCSKIASLQTELSVSPANECAHKFTCLLQDALQAKAKKKRKNKNTFPRNTWFDEECKEKRSASRRLLKE